MTSALLLLFFPKQLEITNMLVLVIITVQYTILKITEASKTTDIKTQDLTNSKSLLFEEDLPNEFFSEEGETKKVAVRNSKIHQQHGKKHAKQHGNLKANNPTKPGNHKPQSKSVRRSPKGNHHVKNNRSPEDTEHERLYKESLKPQKDSHEENENDF